MAEIRFQLLQQAAGTPTRNNLQGSGLAFYGSSAGSSVQIGEYQDNTYVANSTGSSFSDQAFNVKYVTGSFPSGQTILSGQHGATDSIGLSGIKTFQSTLGIEFGHTTAVKVQNCQLRIYDRSNINNPASGVNTKVAEIVNHNGFSGATAYANQGSVGVTSAAIGSGDAVWWGEPWPAALCTQNFYTNSSSVKFYNGLDSETRVNGDSRLASAGIAGSYDTVGGTGVIVPLLDSPGSGQYELQKAVVTGSTGMVWPKWTQYIKTTGNQATFFGSSANNFGDGSDSANLAKTQGGTGIHTHHTWSVALSASPLSIGSKEQYGLYVSMEYL